MAVTLVTGQIFAQSTGHFQTDGISAQLDLPVAATTGNLIAVTVAWLGTGATQVASIADASGGSTSYASVVERHDSDINVEIWAAIAAGTNPGLDVVVSLGAAEGTSSAMITISEWHNDSAWSLAGTPTGTGANVAQTTHDLDASLTPDVADNVIIGAMIGTTTSGYTQPAGYTQLIGADTRGAAAYLIQSSATATTFECSSGAESETTSVAAAAFRASAAGGRTTKNARSTQLGTFLGVKRPFLDGPASIA